MNKYTVYIFLFVCLPYSLNAQGIFKFSSLGYSRALSENSLLIDFRYSPFKNVEAYYGDYGRTALGAFSGCSYAANNTNKALLINNGIKTEFDLPLYFIANEGIKKEFSRNFRITFPLELVHGIGVKHVNTVENNSYYLRNELDINIGLGGVIKEKYLLETMYMFKNGFDDQGYSNGSLLGLRLGILFGA